jgi:cyclic-di-GMP-binding protein
MPSFDIVSRVDLQEIDNAINNAKKEIATRYDFRNSKTSIDFDRKEKKINIVADDKMKMDAVREILQSKAVKRNIDLKSFEFGEPQPTAHAALKREVKVKEGLEQDVAKKIVKMIKDAKLKVQASIQGEEVRVTGKQIDDLQSVMAMLRGAGLEVPLQFVNMKS